MEEGTKLSFRFHLLSQKVICLLVNDFLLLVCKTHDAVKVQLTHDFVIAYRGAAREMAAGTEEFR